MKHFSVASLPLKDENRVSNAMLQDAFIETDRPLSDEEIRQVRSYLARKYGCFIPELFDEFADAFQPVTIQPRQH